MKYQTEVIRQLIYHYRYADVVLSLAECLNEQGKQIWGEPQYSYTWGGNHLYNWAIPRSEILMNENLKQNEGWID